MMAQGTTHSSGLEMQADLAHRALLCPMSMADCVSQDEDGPYRGKFIGKLNSYHHQVSGDIYAVDDS
ncbi:hypothetical protein PYW08_005421 [Mythimna loreyi]|uniref:Uncharacterized protein n=1 Tax=Mythimna loreyi TaxID=667449 RepID=A0ACC2QHK5_9NEOP|nr:hypothetical protein PYW08_005421 [Mythimna loreyi]